MSKQTLNMHSALAQSVVRQTLTMEQRLSLLSGWYGYVSKQPKATQKNIAQCYVHSKKMRRLENMCTRLVSAHKKTCSIIIMSFPHLYALLRCDVNCVV